MDLTTYDKFVVSWSELDGDLTLTFKDETEVTTIGTIKIQATRVRSFLDALAGVALVYAPPINDTTDREHCKTIFSSNKSVTEF